MSSLSTYEMVQHAQRFDCEQPFCCVYGIIIRPSYNTIKLKKKKLNYVEYGKTNY